MAHSHDDYRPGCGATKAEGLKAALLALLGTGKVTALGIKGCFADVFPAMAHWIASTLPKSRLVEIGLQATTHGPALDVLSASKALLAPGSGLRNL